MAVFSSAGIIAERGVFDFGEHSPGVDLDGDYVGWCNSFTEGRGSEIKNRLYRHFLESALQPRGDLLVS